MVRRSSFFRNALWWIAAGLVAGPGCRMAPREQLEDCHRLSQTLRSENARLKDQTLALRSQYQDLSERSVDDARRISQLEGSIGRLETSVQAYQDERTQLEKAYQDLLANLPGASRALSMRTDDDISPPQTHDDDLHRTEASRRSQASRSRPRKALPSSWVPAQLGEADDAQPPLTSDRPSSHNSRSIQGSP